MVAQLWTMLVGWDFTSPWQAEKGVHNNRAREGGRDHQGKETVQCSVCCQCCLWPCTWLDSWNTQGIHFTKHKLSLFLMVEHLLSLLIRDIYLGFISLGNMGFHGSSLWWILWCTKWHFLLFSCYLQQWRMVYCTGYAASSLGGSDTHKFQFADSSVINSIIEW